MSLDAMRWALQQQDIKATHKFVLVAMADRANDDGECWPSIDQLRFDTCLTRNAICDASKALAEAGLIEIRKRFNGSNVYQLIGVPTRSGKVSGRSSSTENRTYGKPYDSSTENRTLTYNQPTNEPKRESARFRAPSVSEVAAYVSANGYAVDAAAFVAYYESNGWRVGRNPMKSWHSAIVTWQRREANGARASPKSGTRSRSLEEDLTDRSWAG